MTDLPRGFGQLLRGAAMVLRDGRRFVLGLLPPLIVGTGFLVLFGLVAWQSPALAGLVTSHEVLRPLLAAAVVVASALLLVLLFSATTLIVGAPVYDVISADVDRAEGWTGHSSLTAAQSLGDAVRRFVTVLAVSLPVGLLLVLVGLVPVVGQVAAAVGSALFGGWMISLEMVGSAAERRGLRTVGERHRLLRRRPLLTWGFGIPVFFAMSVPLLAIVLFPAATAGGTLLARRLHESPARGSRTVA